MAFLGHDRFLIRRQNFDVFIFYGKMANNCKQYFDISPIFCFFVFSMSKYEKPEFSEDDLGENVFLSSLEIKVNQVKSGDKYKVHDKNSGDEAIYELANFEYEATPYCKIFADADRRLKVVELTPRAQGLLMWLFYEVKYGKDWLWLNKVRYMEENKVNSQTTYRGAVNELVKKRYLGKTVVSDVYWINPHFFFNGNRITTFPDNVVKR